MIERYVLGLREVDKTQVAVTGGKGAHLGELSRIGGVCVPAGFCVATDAFRRIMRRVPWIDDRLDRLSRLDPDDREAIRALSAEIRRTLEGIAMPDDLAAAITAALARLGEQAAYGSGEESKNCPVGSWFTALRLTVRNGFEASLVGDAPLLDIDRVSSDHTSCVESFSVGSFSGTRQIVVIRSPTPAASFLHRDRRT